MMGGLDGEVSGFTPSLGLKEVSCEGGCDLRGLQLLLGMLSPGKGRMETGGFLLYRNEINTGLSTHQSGGRHYCC